MEDLVILYTYFRCWFEWSTVDLHTWIANSSGWFNNFKSRKFFMNLKLEYYHVIFCFFFLSLHFQIYPLYWFVLLCVLLGALSYIYHPINLNLNTISLYFSPQFRIKWYFTLDSGSLGFAKSLSGKRNKGMTAAEGKINRHTRMKIQTSMWGGSLGCKETFEQHPSLQCYSGRHKSFNELKLRVCLTLYEKCVNKRVIETEFEACST